MISDKNKQLFTQKRTVLEPDLTLTISSILANQISDSASSMFVLDKNIISVKDKLHPVQMIIVNKWFRELLIIAKGARPDLRITDALMCIEDNIKSPDWVKLYTVAIIPFIKNNNILG